MPRTPFQFEEKINVGLILRTKCKILYKKKIRRSPWRLLTRCSTSGIIQHSAHIPPCRDGLFNLIKSVPPTLKYEPGMIAADGDFVIVHGRFSGHGRPANWIAADILRIKDGILVEHWDVIQDEATREQSKSGKPMFGDTFPVYA
jgi:predicted SnoaL-like aldol condensation-catalyzing enzyme